ncbi:ABC transporter substrate-binding protein [soil metagenome]
MKLHRKWFGLLIAMALVIPSANASAQDTTLTIAALQGSETEGLQALEPMYEEATGVQLEIVQSPYADLYTKLVTAFETNDATYDLVMLDDPWMPKFGTMGALTDLTPLGIEQDPDIPQIVWDVGTWPPPHGAVPPSEVDKPSELLGVTVVGNVQMFMYRCDITPEPPASYEEVLARAQEQNTADFAGYIIRGKATNPVVADFLPILWSFGGDVFDADWNVVFDSPESLAAVKFVIEDLKAVAQPDPANTDAADRSRLMSQGGGYQSSIWPGEINTIVLGEGTTLDTTTVCFTPIPAGPSGSGVGMMGNWMLAIPKASENQQAAADFIKWMLQADTQKTYAENNGIPSRTSVLKDETLTEANPYFPVLADALQAPPNWRPRTDQWNAVEAIIGQELNGALAGLKSAEDAVAAASSQIRGLMAGAGYPTAQE